MLLVHSPLVGPTTWRPVADLLRHGGTAVAVPDLTGVADAPGPHWRWFVDAAVGAADGLAGPVTVAGHSGAGALLPAIGAALADRCAGLVFVDAVVPPTDGVHRTSPAMVGFLDEQTVDGRLRPWLDWWPAEVVADLVPDAAARAALAAELPRLPRAFYDEEIPVPDGWSAGACGYLRLSAAYDDDLAEAQRRGWPTRVLDTTHLGQFTDPGPAAAAIAALAGRAPV